MAVQPGKPHWVSSNIKIPPDVVIYPIVTPIQQTIPPQTFTSKVNNKTYHPLEGYWWKVMEHDSIYHESCLRPLDNPGDDEVDTHSLRKEKEHV